MAKGEKSSSAAVAKGKDQQAGASESAAKPKGKKLLLIGVSVLVLAGAGGAAWYFTKGDSGHEETAKKEAYVKLEQPKFIPLETFTVNLQRGEEGDQFLQVGVTLKIDNADLEEKIKLVMPEIRSRLLLLLSGKHAFELAPVSGKKKLAQEIIQEVNGALGISPPKHAKKAGTKRKVNAGEAPPVGAPTLVPSGVASAPVEAESVAEDSAAEAEQDAEMEEVEQETEEASGILDVLFTSFIIQ